MNQRGIPGPLVRQASVKGKDRKIMQFTVETRDGHDEGDTKERVNQAPCVLFNHAPKLE